MLKNFVTSLHQSTRRNYLERMNNDKVNCMVISKKYGEDYWDGDRRYGYGGYKFIPGYWKSVAQAIIKDYKLSNQSKIIDLGCGKGYLLYEIKLILPHINIVGIDISAYAINNSKDEVKPYLNIFDARNTLPFENKEFDLVISLGTLHNFRIPELKKVLKEINRVSKKSYIMVESYRNEKELFNLQCWALTAETFLDNKEWQWLYKEFGYKGDFEFIYFE